MQLPHSGHRSSGRSRDSYITLTGIRSDRYLQVDGIGMKLEREREGTNSKPDGIMRVDWIAGTARILLIAKRFDHDRVGQSSYIAHTGEYMNKKT